MRNQVSALAIALAIGAASASPALAQPARRLEVTLEPVADHAPAYYLVARVVRPDRRSTRLGLDDLRQRHSVEASLGGRSFRPALVEGRAWSYRHDVRPSFELPNWPGLHRLSVTVRSNDGALAGTGHASVRVDQAIRVDAVPGRGPRCAALHRSVRVDEGRLARAARAMKERGARLYAARGRSGSARLRGPATLCVDVPAWGFLRFPRRRLTPYALGLLADPEQEEPTVRLVVGASMGDGLFGLGVVVALGALGLAVGVRRERDAARSASLAYAFARVREGRGYRDEAKARLSAPLVARGAVDLGESVCGSPAAALRIVAGDGVFVVDAEGAVVVFGLEGAGPLLAVGPFTAPPGVVVVEGDLAIALFDARTERRVAEIVAGLSPEALASARRGGYGEVPPPRGALTPSQRTAVLALGAATAAPPVAAVVALHARWPVFGETGPGLAVLAGGAALVLVLTGLARRSSASASAAASRRRT